MERICYTDEWQRTRPDYAVYLPELPGGRDEYADHIHVFYTPGGDLMAIWTQASAESAPDNRTVYSRSPDHGETWEPIQVIDEPLAPGLTAALGFPVVSRSGRIYCFYNQNIGASDNAIFSGLLRIKYSDDDGRTWISGNADIQFRHTKFDHPDPKVPRNCIIWQQPIRDARERLIVGMSRWSNSMIRPKPKGGNRFHYDTHCELIRFDNIDEGPHPKDIVLTWLPDDEGAISVSCGIEPDASAGYSLAEEPAIVLLPDGRLFMNMRTVRGQIWYSVSDDDGHTWRETEPLRYRDGGPMVEHPKSPDPHYRLQDGRYLLFFHNHDGTSYGADGPWDMEARRPLFMTVGAFRPDAHQPLWFSEPKFLCDTERVTVGVTSLTWLAMYASLTERDGERVFWYADRKQFVVGKRITDEMLSDMKVPEFRP